MEDLSNIAKAEKNKLNSDSVFLIALDIDIPDVAETIRIVNNNEDVTWAGVVYQAFPFQLEEIGEATNGEVSEFTLNVSNANNVIGTYVRKYDAYVKNNGFEAIDVTLSVINTNNLSSADPEVQHKATLISPTINAQQVSFTLGGVNAYNKVVHKRMLRNGCRFRFKSVQCGYSGSQTVCNKTYSRCQELNNQTRFGGFPTIGNDGIIS